MTSPGEGLGGSLLGVVLAGGESLRFGRPKALAPLGGRPMAEWARKTLSACFPQVVTISKDSSVAEALGIPGRVDRIPGLGPLGGLLSALEWAEEEGMRGVFLLACDLPLVRSDLVRRIVEAWREDALAVVPESHGPLGLEPLCALYSADCLPFVRKRISAPNRSLAALLEDVEAQTIAATDLGSMEDLALAFSNVNTLQDRLQIEALLLSRGQGVATEPCGGVD